MLDFFKYVINIQRLHHNICMFIMYLHNIAQFYNLDGEDLSIWDF